MFPPLEMPRITNKPISKGVILSDLSECGLYYEAKKCKIPKNEISAVLFCALRVVFNRGKLNGFASQIFLA